MTGGGRRKSDTDVNTGYRLRWSGWDWARNGDFRASSRKIRRKIYSMSRRSPLP